MRTLQLFGSQLPVQLQVLGEQVEARAVLGTVPAYIFPILNYMLLY